MLKTNRGGAEEPTIIFFFNEIDNIEFRPKYIIPTMQRRHKQYLATSVLGDSYCLPAVTYAKWGGGGENYPPSYIFLY